MRVFQGMATSISALTAEKMRLDVTANNIANINTTRTPEGGAFRRKMVVFREVMEKELNQAAPNQLPGRGVMVEAIVPDMESPLRREENSAHPDADEEGFVWYSNVDLSLEIFNMMNAQRSYQVNVNAFKTSREMAERALDLGRG